MPRGPLDTRQQFEILAHRLGTQEDLDALVLTVADAGRTMRWPTVIRSGSESSGLRFLISRNTSALYKGRKRRVPLSSFNRMTTCGESAFVT